MLMQSQIEINGKPVEILLTAGAEKALASRTKPLHVVMELYFSCLIRKKVRFYQQSINNHEQQVNDNLFVLFRPVMTQHCGKDYEGTEPPLTDFPIVKSAPFIPRWLNIDYHNGEWYGEFGFKLKPSALPGFGKPMPTLQ